MSHLADRFLEQFEARASERASLPDSLRTLTEQAMERAVALDFPTVRNEEWKYTNVSGLARTPFQSPSLDRSVKAVPIPFAEVGAWRMVFLDGRFCPDLSSAARDSDLPLPVCLAHQAARPDVAFEQEFAHHALTDNQAFVALNTAMMQDGVYWRVPAGAQVDQPIHLLFLSTGSGAVASHPRNLMIFEEGARASVIESYCGLNGGTYLTNAVTEIVVRPGAIVDHYKLQCEGAEAFHIATMQTHQSEHSVFRSHSISLGAALARNDINTVLAGTEIESTINGLYAVRGKQHVDNHTLIDHAQPRCTSHELYKGIIDELATGVFNGKVFVRQDAQKTDAKQTNQNLLLSREATINTKPQLEIYADDVRCTHGATVGQLDEEALFYLRARGIGLEEARGLLTYAFASDILGRIQVPALRTALEQRLWAQLPGQRRSGTAV